MNRRYFVKGMGTITLYSFLPMPAVFDNKYEWDPFETTTSGKPDKKHNYAMIVVQDRCIGCKACEKACKAAWNVPKDPELYRTKVLYRAKAQSYSSKMTWLPVLCNQCDNPPCVKVCPTRASFKREEDGIVLIRADKCIGCKTCMLACPYEARYYNDNIHSADKCTFCLPRIIEGKTTACVESCYKNARIFGDLSDPESEVSKIMKEAVAYHTLKPEEGTLCNVYYTNGI